MKRRRRTERTTRERTDADRHAPDRSVDRPVDRPVESLRRPRPRLLGKRCVVASLLALTVVLLAPTFVCHTPLYKSLAGYFNPLPGTTIHVKQVRLGWFTPLQLTGVELLDVQQQPLLRFEKLDITRCLGQLLISRGDLQKIALERPEIWIRQTDGGTNWHTILQRLTGSSGHGPSGPWPELILRKGTLHAHTTADTELTVDEIECQISSAVNGALPTIDLTGRLAAGEQSGTIRFRHEPADAQRAAIAQLQLDHLPLQLASVLGGLGFEDMPQLGGWVDFTATCSSTDRQWQHWIASVDLEGQQWQVDAPRWMGTDQPRWESVRLALKAEATADGIELERLQLTTPWLSVQGTGTIAPETFGWSSAESTTGEQPTSSSGGNLPTSFELDGALELPGLAHNFPSLLRLRRDVQWESGRAVWKSTIIDSGGNRDITLALQLTDVAAQDATTGQRIQWSRPVELSSQILWTPRHWVLQQLTVNTEFAEVTASGSTSAGRFDGQLDLERLDHQLRQIADLPWQQMGGQTRWTGTWQAQQSVWQWQCSGQARQLHLTTRDAQQLTEPVVLFQSSGKLLRAGAPTEDSAQITNSGTPRQPPLTAHAASSSSRLDWSTTVQFGQNDLVRWALLEPVALPGSADSQTFKTWSLPIQLDLAGDATSWRERLRPWCASLPEMSGEVRGQARLRVGPGELDLLEGDIHLRPAELKLGELRISEPRSQFKAAFHYDANSGRWTSDTLSLLTTSLSVAARQIAWNPHDSGQPLPSGTVTLHGRLDRLNESLNQQLTRWGLPAQGRIVGTLQNQYEPAGAVWSGQLSLDGGQLTRPTAALAPTSATAAPNSGLAAPSSATAAPSSGSAAIAIPDLELEFRGRWPTGAQLPVMDECRLQSDWGSLEARSYVVPHAPELTIETQGQVQFVWDRIFSDFAAPISPLVTLRGSIPAPFSVRYTLLAPGSSAPDASRYSLETQATVRWDGGQLLGLPIGAGETKVHWRAEQLDLGPTEFSVGTGVARLSARAQTRPPYRIALAPGRVLDRIELQPELCRRYLKYVAPLAGDVASAEGTLGVDVARLEFPLQNFREIEASGRVEVAEARLGPGPLSQQILQVAQQMKSLVRPGSGTIMREDTRWVLMPEQAIEFATQQGRVFHRRAQFVIGEQLQLDTSGSVGFDETLDLVVELMVPSEWAGASRTGRVLAGQRLRIPVRGTVGQPQLNVDALQQLVGQNVQGAAETLLRQEMGHQLDKLIPGLGGSLLGPPPSRP